MKKLIRHGAIALICLLSPLVAQVKKPSDNIGCLAKAIYYEASNQSTKGQQAIAFVLFNRSEKYNVGICEVIRKKLGGPFLFQKRQFNARQYKNALVLAKEMYENREEYEDPTESALYFHAIRGANRAWTKNLVRTVRIQGHIFYRDPD